MKNAIAHLNEAFRWSTEQEVAVLQIAASGLGVGLPILIALFFHHLEAGMVAAVGGMAMSGTLSADGLPAQLNGLGSALLPFMVASLVAVLLAGHGLATDISIIGLIVAAAVVGGYSRKMVAATTRFILFLVLVGNIVGETASHRVAVFCLVLGGAALAAIVTLILGMAAFALKPEEGAATRPAPQPTAQQKFARWKRVLRTAAGWQYAGRLFACLVAALLLRGAFPGHHPQWVVLSVVILVQRPVERLPLKTTQRAFGVGFGVMIAAGLLLVPMPGWLFAGCAGLLGAARPLLRVRNYIAYSAVMTPLMIMAMDATGHLAPSLLTDRLLATVIAAVLVLVANQATIALWPEVGAASKG